ncbi:MAG: hypothetical protein ACYS5V_08445, partial [Planctomycetota bacterium]
MRRENRTLPTAEPLEPRLLMSRTLYSDLFASSELISVPAAGGLSITDQISAGVAAKMYRFTAPAKGKLQMVMSGGGSGIDSVLQVFNARGRRIRRNDNASRGTTDSRVRLAIRPGQVYYVAASSRDNTAGEYALEFTSVPKDDFGNSFDAARTLRLTAVGAGRAAGQINYAGDVDMLRFVATRTGRMQVDLSPAGRGNTLDGDISACDAAGGLLSTDNAGVLTVDVVEGQTYFLKVAGAGATTGRYRLRIHPTTPEMLVAAEPLALPAAGSVTASGSLATGGTKSYKFTASAEGEIRIRMAADGSGVDPGLLVYNAKGKLVARNLDAASDAALNLWGHPSSTYYVIAVATNGSSGAYSLLVESRPVDDYGNTIASSSAMGLDADGSGSIYGKIDYAGDADVLSVVAKANGTMQVSVTPASITSGLAGIVSVYDAAGSLVDSDPGSVTVEVVDGQVYYLRVADAAAAEGRYRLDVSTEADAVLPPTPPELDPLPGDAVTGEVLSTSAGMQLLVIGTEGADDVTLSQSGSSVTLVSGAGRET